MAKIFGIDIAAVVNTAIADAGGVRSGTLSAKDPGTRTAGSLTAGSNPATTTHTFSGFVEDGSKRLKGTVIGEGVSVVSILGASVSPARVPEINDQVTIDGVTYQLVELLERDPASAMFEFRATHP